MPSCSATGIWRWAIPTRCRPGKYGKAALTKLGVWDAVKDKVAQADNVRAALKLVSTGEAPLGIVYGTDAKSDPNVKVIDIFPEGTHPPIIYPCGNRRVLDQRRRAGPPRLSQVGGGAEHLQGSRLQDPVGQLGRHSRESGNRVTIASHHRTRIEGSALLFTLTQEEWTAVELSLRVAALATVASLPVGVIVAMVLARGRFYGRALFNALVLLPLILPPVVTGYVLLLLFGKKGPLGAFLADNFGIVLAFRWTGAALACAIMGFPLMVRAIQLSVEGVDVKLEQAASMRWSPQNAVVAAAVMVMPRSCSWGIQSIVAAPSWTSPIL